MRVFPKGVTGQIAGIMIGSVVLAQFLTAILFIYAGVPRDPWRTTTSAAQISAIIRILDALPADARPKAIAAVSSAGVVVRSVAADMVPEANANDPDVEAIGHLVRMEISHPTGIELIAVQKPIEPTGSMPIYFRLTDGTYWILDVAAEPNRGSTSRGSSDLGPPGMVPPDLIKQGAFLAVFLVAISVWVARRVTVPLSRFAAAAERLGTGGEETLLPEKGPAEIKQAARAFNRMQERLVRFLADRTRMLAAISHDLRTPLTRLRLRIETITDLEQRKKMLGDLHMMDMMLTSTLAFIRDDGQSEPVIAVDLAAMLQTICDEFADAGSDARYSSPAHCPFNCRAQSLTRALANLVDNAIKFGGTAIVRLDADSLDDIFIDIEDEGPGIPEAEREKVFEPFYRSDPARNSDVGGFGLGLSIARSIIHAHGGSIAFLSRLPHGLCVRVTLPKTRSTSIVSDVFDALKGAAINNSGPTNTVNYVAREQDV